LSIRWRAKIAGITPGTGRLRSDQRERSRRITFAYMMNKMAPGGGTIAAALAERVKDIVNR
jgi:hypothetical protein